MRCPRSNRWVICDVCGFKFHAKDVTKVGDKYNRHYGLVVCKKDIDITNQQDIPYKYKEMIVSDLIKIRPRPSFEYVINPNGTSRVPSAPQNGLAILDSLSKTINLYWDGPIDTGSSGITGYIVQCANPQFSNYASLTSNTNINTCFYQDTTNTPTLNSSLSYRVAAINDAGTGPYSTEFYWPTENVTASTYVYIGISDGSSVLATSSGIPILLSPKV